MANVDVTPGLALNLGLALAGLNRGGCTVVGRDPRVTGEALALALRAGLAAGGGDVLDVGLAPTPCVAWMVVDSGSSTGVAVTASHNPPQYNGFKVFNSRGYSVTGEEQAVLEEALADPLGCLAEWSLVGAVEMVDGVEGYLEALSGWAAPGGGFKVGLDCFHGAASLTAPRAFQGFTEAQAINAIPDGSFPSGPPEPNAETLARLGKFVVERGLSLGFGFDGDGDRFMVVDHRGKVVDPDRLLAAYAGFAVEAAGGGVVVTHVGASMCVDEVVEEAGGEVVRTPVGDAYVTEALVEAGGVFGGEPVGAWVFPEAHLCPDGVLGALKLLEALGELGVSVGEFVEGVPSYPLRRAKVECPEAEKARVMGKVAEEYAQAFPGAGEASTVDGVRVETPRGWVLVRPSGTEPLIRITVEGRTEEDAGWLLGRAVRLVEGAKG